MAIKVLLLLYCPVRGGFLRIDNVLGLFQVLRKFTSNVFSVVMINMRKITGSAPKQNSINSKPCSAIGAMNSQKWRLLSGSLNILRQFKLPHCLTTVRNKDEFRYGYQFSSGHVKNLCGIYKAKLN